VVRLGRNNLDYYRRGSTTWARALPFWLRPAIGKDILRIGKCDPTHTAPASFHEKMNSAYRPLSVFTEQF
jgi:hypothetical protein